MVEIYTSLCFTDDCDNAMATDYSCVATCWLHKNYQKEYLLWNIRLLFANCAATRYNVVNYI